jgi:hypothetical protein
MLKMERTRFPGRILLAFAVASLITVGCSKSSEGPSQAALDAPTVQPPQPKMDANGQIVAPPK